MTPRTRSSTGARSWLRNPSATNVGTPTVTCSLGSSSRVRNITILKSSRTAPRSTVSWASRTRSLSCVSTKTTSVRTRNSITPSPKVSAVRRLMTLSSITSTKDPTLTEAWKTLGRPCQSVYIPLYPLAGPAEGTAFTDPTTATKEHFAGTPCHVRLPRRLCAARCL